MTIADIISWVAVVVLLYGLKLIGDKRTSGFYVAIVAEVLWAIWGCMTHSLAVIFVSVYVTVMYVRAIMKWEQMA